MELAKHTTDPAKEQSGIWVKFDDETELLIGSLNSRIYKTAYGKRIDDLRREKRKPDAMQVEGIINDAYAETILLGWKNVVENGVPVEYSVAKAKFIMENCPAVREFVLITAANNDNFRKELLVEARKNAGES